MAQVDKEGRGFSRAADGSLSRRCQIWEMSRVPSAAKVDWRLGSIGAGARQATWDAMSFTVEASRAGFIALSVVSTRLLRQPQVYWR